VAEAIEQCHAAGICVVMITGDQVATAASISKKIGIVRKGEDQEQKSQECKNLHVDPSNPAASEFHELQVVDNLTTRTVVWARAQPVDKVCIVESLQRQGQIAAMTGDGVNDAAALKVADMGTAMGISGTSVAKGAAGMLLLDDNFTTIVEAVRLGRQVYGNLQKYVYYYIGMKIAELLMFIICVCAQLWKPVSGLSGLLGKNITHDTVPLFMVYEQPEPYQMRTAPRPRREFIFTRLLFLSRWIPFVLYYQFFVLGGSLLLARLYTNNVLPKYSVDKLSDWHDNKHFCILAYKCKWNTTAGTASSCKKTSNPAICRVPSDRIVTTDPKKERTWFYEYGSPQDASAISADSDALMTFPFDGKVKNQHHELASRERTWIPMGGDRYAMTLPDASAPNGNTDPFLALVPCKPSKGSLWMNTTDPVPFGYDSLCWTMAAKSKFGYGKDDALQYPYLDPFNNVGAWMLRKLQGATWVLFVNCELTHYISCRTENWFFLAPHNIKFYVWLCFVTIMWIIMVNVPALANFIGYAPMDGYVCAVTYPACLGMLICDELFKFIFRRLLQRQQEYRIARNVYMNPVGYQLPEQAEQLPEYKAKVPEMTI